MNLVKKQTKFYTTESNKPNWLLVDANGKTLGRLATKVASYLRGKHKSTFTPNADMGDFVVVINAKGIKLTGKRAEMKEYFRYSGYPGGVTFEKFKELIATKPERIIEYAVKGMLPKTKLGDKIGKKLKVYASSDHPHFAQKPKVVESEKK